METEEGKKKMAHLGWLGQYNYIGQDPGTHLYCSGAGCPRVLPGEGQSKTEHFMSVFSSEFESDPASRSSVPMCRARSGVRLWSSLTD